MNYQINFENYSSNFSLPSLIVENDFKDINSDYLKIILMIFKNSDKNYSVNLLSNLLNLSERTVTDAIAYWIEKGVLLSSSQPSERRVYKVSDKKMPEPAKSINDSELKYLLATMEMILQRSVTSTDLKTITYIYEYYRLPADVILMAIQYAVEKGKNSMKYIEKVCIDWYDKGIVNHTLAEEYLKLASEQQNHYRQIKIMFGIGERKLIASEEKFIDSWFEQLHFDLEMIRLAYERTIKNTGKVAFAYTNKILTNWHKKGLRTVDEVMEKEPTVASKKSNSSNTSYDMAALERFWENVPIVNSKKEEDS